jgi:hypothetical protein
MTYSSNYKQQKPLSSRLKVESGTTEPQKVKRKPKATAKPQGMPAYMKPVRTSGKAQGIEEGSAADVKDYLYSQGDTSSLTPMELHAAQMLANGNEDALDVF